LKKSSELRRASLSALKGKKAQNLETLKDKDLLLPFLNGGRGRENTYTYHSSPKVTCPSLLQ
jgi:hypothetical protein